MGLEYPIRLASVERMIRARHGSDRALIFDELLIVRDFASTVVEEVRWAWPVETGLSRSGWTFTMINRAGELSVTIVNRIPYVQYIRRRGTPADTPLYEDLVPTTVKSHAPAMLRRIEVEIARTEAALATVSDPTEWLARMAQPQKR